MKVVYQYNVLMFKILSQLLLKSASEASSTQLRIYQKGTLNNNNDHSVEKIT